MFGLIFLVKTSFWACCRSIRFTSVGGGGQGDVKPRRVADAKLRKLTLDAAHHIGSLLQMRDRDPEAYRCLLMGINLLGYCDHWLVEGPDGA